MSGFRLIATLLVSLFTIPAQAGEIMNLSIPAPERLGAGTEFSTRSSITWNSARIDETTVTVSSPAIAPIPQSTQVAMALNLPAYGLRDNALFGRQGLASNDTSAFTKWTDVIAREQQEMRGPHSPQVTEWLTFLAGLQGLPRNEQLAAVNNYANGIRYVDDAQNYAANDHWATTSEFLARGGDCEDYAITKFVSLQMLGFDTAKMRVVILFDQDKQLRHAVLAVEDGGTTQILDNQSRRIVAAADIDHYQPIYAISQSSWWRYV